MDLQRRYAPRKNQGYPEGEVAWETHSLTVTGKLLFATNAEMRYHSRTEKNENGPFSQSTVEVADDIAWRANTNSCLEPSVLGVVSID